MLRREGYPELFLDEHKTKGIVDQKKISQQLKFDRQTMYYLTSLVLYWDENGTLPGVSKRRMPKTTQLGGVRYNVVRRPLSSSPGMIKPLGPKTYKGDKPDYPGETEIEFLTRLHDKYLAAMPETFFCRWEVPITREDIEEYRKQFLTPMLLQISNWWDSIQYDPFNPWVTSVEHLHGIIEDPNCDRKALTETPNPHHWRHPYGCYNHVDNAMDTDWEHMVNTGESKTLRRIHNLFPELTQSNA